MLINEDFTKQGVLPVDEVIPELLESLTRSPNAVLHAPPGAGKTTRVPLALLDLVPAAAGRIIMLEPRRLAALSAAKWMSRMLGEEVGGKVGYSIRFDSRSSVATRIEVVTEGILTRRIQHDPALEGVAMVIFDEFHERSIHADLGLALCLELQRLLRPDLKILVMSATLDSGAIAKLLGDAPIITSAGRSFPVEEIYLEKKPQGSLATRTAAAVRQALSETAGDLLVFLPGAGEIRTTAALLRDANMAERGVSVHQLYGDLPFDQQQNAILPGAGRRVVLATNIAETSLTIEGIRVVIDSGLSRRLRHDQASGMNRLVTVRESRSSAEQRKGRAGRVAPGTCYRLYSRHTFNAMSPHTPPEMLEADLSPLLLELVAWGTANPGELPWLDPPPEAPTAVARKLLFGLGALDQSGRITAKGKEMVRLPLHPRLAGMLLQARDNGYLALGCDLAALLSERDIIPRASTGTQGTRSFDLPDRLELLRKWRVTGRAGAFADIAAVKGVIRTADQLLRFFCAAPNTTAADPEQLERLLLIAYPDRVARLREGDGNRYLLASGRGAKPAYNSELWNSEYIVALSVDAGEQGEGVIHQAVPISEELIRSELAGKIEEEEKISWDTKEGRVVAVREEHLGAVRLSSRTFIPRPDDVVPLIVSAVRESSLKLLSLDEALRQLQGRVLLLRTFFSQDGWPDFSDEGLLQTLELWLSPHVIGLRTAGELGNLKLAPLLAASLDYRSKQALDELAPTHLVVPSGSRIRIDYATGEQPVLPVKLQELFGLGETPTVARGRVKLLLHLLSPAGRPIQVTQDLKGFWDGSYHQVKKELKGRYPKHPWPDDPWSAPPTRRVKSRMG